MKIRKIKFKEHPVLGNLKLDFTYKDEAGNEKVYDNIIFAGENGTGKTTIFKMLDRVLKKPDYGVYDDDGLFIFEYLELQNSTDENIRIYTNKDIHKSLPEGFYNTRCKESYEKRTPTLHLISSKENSKLTIKSVLDDFSSTLLKPRITHDSREINIVRSTNIPKHKTYMEDGENDENYLTSLKQYIVDLDNEDIQEYVLLNKASREKPIPWEDFYASSNINIFAKAFNTFFENIIFDGVDNSDYGEKQVIFKKGENSIDINMLSTGEQQLVFRTIYLLKNINRSLKSLFIMVDEPEIGMHPTWQRKILDYYISLFKSEKTEKTIQMFFATHSNHVLENAIEKENCGIFILSEKDGNIKSTNIKRDDDKGEMLLPTTTSAELNYHAFNLSTFEYHNQLYGEVLSRCKLAEGYIGTLDLSIRCFIREKYAGKATDLLITWKNTGGENTEESLPTFIRNKTHHPDNKDRSDYKEEELKKSIKLLRKMLSINLNNEPCDNCKKLEKARNDENKEIRKANSKTNLTRKKTLL